MHRRTGSATRGLLILVALAALLLVVLRLVMDGAEPASSDPGSPGEVASAESAAGIQLGTETASPGLEAPDGSRARAGGAPLGVRLAGPARLEGRVVDRASGAGVAGARVELLSVPPAGTTLLTRVLRLMGLGPEMTERVLPIAAVATDEGGRFAFQGVRAGSWFLEARGPYSAPENVVRARTLASGAGGPIEVFVRAGGRVLGKVVRPDGSPAPGAKIVLLGGPGRFLEDAATGDLRIFEAACDAQGAFVFEGVPPGAGYDLSASGQGFAISHRLGVDVAAGRDAEVVVRARAGGTIAGRVLSGGGDAAPPAGGGDAAATPPVGGGAAAPLAGAHVAAVPRGLRDLLLVAEILASTHCVTDADGGFVMQNVPPGEVDLAAYASDHLPALGAHVAVADGARASGGVILLSRGTVVRGRTVDGAGAPVAGVQVRWNPLQGYDVPGGVLTFAPYLVRAIPGFVFPRSDADGRFAAGPLGGEAPWRLEFSKLGFEDQTDEIDAAEAATEITVVMVRGGSVEGVVMDEARSEPVTEFTVSGNDRIDAEAGAPSKWNPFSGGVTFEDALGRFRVDSIAAGKAELTFSAPGYADEVVEVEVVEGQTTQGVIVKLRPGGTVRGMVVDEESRPVAGAQVVAVTEEAKKPGARVRAQRTGRRENQGPFEGFAVGMRLGAGDIPPAMMGYAASLGLLGDKVVMSDSSGAFEVRGVSAGEVTVRAFHRDHAWGASDPLTLAEGALVSGVEVVLHEGGAIEGHVTDRHGNPVPDDIVVALAPSAMAGGGGGQGGGLYQGQSDEEGAYRIDHMAGGSYFLLVTRGDEALNPMSFMGNLNFDLVTVPENQTVRFDVVDRSAGGCRVHGIVTDQGKPVPGGNLLALNFESGSLLGLEFKAARVGDDGKFEFAGLAPGDYQLQLEDADLRARMWLEVPDQAELFVTVAIPEGGLEGTVVDDATGQGVEGAVVVLRALGEPEAEGMLARLVSRESRSEQRVTEDDGRFTFARLREADYEVSVRPPRGSSKIGDLGYAVSPGAGKRWAPADPKIVRIGENRVERGLELRLLPALALSGIVKDSQGAPVKGATVLVSLQDAPDAPFERDRTDEDGRFDVSGLSPGVYTATASAKDHADGILRDVKVERGPTQPKDVEIRLPKGVRVSVRVFGPDGQPVSGARAQLTSEKGDAKMQAANAGRIMSSLFSGEGASDSEGRIDLGRYAPGEYRLEVQRGLARAETPKVKVPADRDQIELRADLP